MSKNTPKDWRFKLIWNPREPYQVRLSVDKAMYVDFSNEQTWIMIGISE